MSGTQQRAGRSTVPALDAMSQRILDVIHERGLGPGDPIPTEPELVDVLAVSRNSVREAIRPLRALGIVEVRRGHGTVVAEPSLRALSPSLAFRVIAGSARSGETAGGAGALAELRHLVEIRELIEAGAAERLVREVDAATVERLSELCDEMTREGPNPEVDREFHRLLYSTVDNPLIGQLVDVFWDAYQDARGVLEAPSKEAAEDTTAKHRRIAEALRNEDAEALRSAMSRHFAEIKQRIDAAAPR